MKLDPALTTEDDLYCTLQYATDKFNSENIGYDIQLTDLLRFGELNLIPLKFECHENLRLVVWDDQRNIENEIGTYTYGSIVAILDYSLDPDHVEAHNYFTTHKVRPINLDLLKNRGITSPKPRSEFLYSPYYFVPYLHPSEIFKSDDTSCDYEDSVVETHNLLFTKSDLPNIKVAAERLMNQSENTVDEIDLKHRGEIVETEKPATAITQSQFSNNTFNKLSRRNHLDAAIDEAINLAGNTHTADVYIQLKELALNEFKPFTGNTDNGTLSYTDDNDILQEFTKNALRKRLKNRH